MAKSDKPDYKLAKDPAIREVQTAVERAVKAPDYGKYWVQFRLGRVRVNGFAYLLGKEGLSGSSVLAMAGTSDSI